MRGRVMLSRLDDKKREKFWLCPLCNFLTHRPDICDRCRAGPDAGAASARAVAGGAVDDGGVGMKQVDLERYHELRKHWNTHDFPTSVDCPICRKCGESPISLGIWGDDHWRETHEGWKERCQGSRQQDS